MLRVGAAADDKLGRAGEQLSAADVLRPLTAVATRAGLVDLSERLGALREWLSDDLAALERGLRSVEAALADTSHGRTGTERAAAHLLHLPGKRIRPLCVLLAARLGPAPANDAQLRPIAMACELVHAATLLHDDVVDDSTERRGAPAARLLYGNSASILAGDHLLVHALSLVHGAQTPDLLTELLDVMRRMVQAEAWQLERRGGFAPSRPAYLEVIRGKTAALFGWGLLAGARLARLPEQQAMALAEVGNKLGMAFQLVDDLLDLTGDPSVTGKSTLHDVREGKLTWPLIIASERDPWVLDALRQLALVHEPVGAGGAERLATLIARIERTGALAETRAFAIREADDAGRLLTQLPHSRALEALHLVVQAAVHRVC